MSDDLFRVIKWRRNDLSGMPFGFLIMWRPRDVEGRRFAPVKCSWEFGVWYDPPWRVSRYECDQQGIPVRPLRWWWLGRMGFH